MYLAGGFDQACRVLFGGSAGLRATTAAAECACLGCGYDLRGMSGLTPICPECGLEHDLPRMIARLSVVRVIGRRMLDVLSIPIGWLVLMCVVLVIGASATLPGGDPRGEGSRACVRVGRVHRLRLGAAWSIARLHRFLLMRCVTSALVAREDGVV